MLFRHSFLSFISCSFSLLSLANSSPCHGRDTTNGTESTTVYYYGVDQAEHDKRSQELKANGHGVISLSAYGSSPNVSYAAVWAKQQQGSGSFELISGVDEVAFNAWVEEWKGKGYVSTHVTATGAADSAVYAGVMERAEAGLWVQLCSLRSPWGFENATMGVAMAIKGISMYGASSDRRYCVLGHENSANQQQTVFYSTSSFAYNYEEVYTAETKKRYWRPVYLDVSDDHLVTPIFDDTSVGKWAALTALTEAQLASEIAAQAQKGLFPVHLQAGASDAATDAHYAVIFAEQSAPLARQWHATGTVSGFQDNASVTSGLDSTMRAFMQANGVRQAQVAVAVNGTLAGERAYTWAEDDRAVVAPADKFLLASVSKMFTHAAMQKLIDAGQLNLTTRVLPLLGYGELLVADARALDITVQHLVDHTAGFDRYVSGDVGFFFTTVAQAMGKAAPATLRDVIEYVLARPLDFTPGEYPAYSNFGTMLLSYLATNLTGVPFLEFLQDNVFGGLEVELYETAGDKHVLDAIVQETKFMGISALEPLSAAQVPAVYGGDGAVKEEMAGVLSLRASASTVARFIGENAVWGIGGHQQFNSRDGSLSGARSYAESRYNMDWAITLNTREYTSEDVWSRLIYSDIPTVWDFNSLA